MHDRISDAIESNDLDELLHIVDALCDTRDWDMLVSLRDRARRALERGRQLWPAASHAEYRLALDAPAPYAAAMLTPDAARFAAGPVAEVAASTHTWAELQPHAPAGPVAALAAHECVVRGEVVDAATVSHAEVLSVPLTLQRWEPEYLVAQYRADGVELTGPDPFHGRRADVGGREPRGVDDPDVDVALRDVVRQWTAGSEGRARTVAVHGDAVDAVAALAPGGDRDVRMTWVDGAEGMRLLAWAGASGGRHGRRRGAAAGRDAAWAAAAALAGFALGDPVEPDALGAAIAELRWCVWSAADVAAGWVLRLAVEDPAEGLAWAIDAHDRA